MRRTSAHAVFQPLSPLPGLSARVPAYPRLRRGLDSDTATAVKKDRSSRFQGALEALDPGLKWVTASRYKAGGSYLAVSQFAVCEPVPLESHPNSSWYNVFMAVTLKRRWFQLTMLVVMTLACVGLGWLAYERNEVRKRRQAIAAIQEFGGDVRFDVKKPFRPKWLRPLLGDDSAGEVEAVGHWGAGGGITDAQLVHLRGLTELKFLDLRRHPQLTGAGLVHLQNLTELEILELSDTQVSDAGLVHLKRLKKLEWLNLYGTRVTEQGASELQKALPNTQITR